MGEHDEAKTEEARIQRVATAAEKNVDDHTFATLTVCDATKGIIHKEYDGQTCESEPEYTFEATWGACVKAPDGSYVKITGASDLKAAAIALVAFAGSQF